MAAVQEVIYLSPVKMYAVSCVVCILLGTCVVNVKGQNTEQLSDKNWHGASNSKSEYPQENIQSRDGNSADEIYHATEIFDGKHLINNVSSTSATFTPSTPRINSTTLSPTITMGGLNPSKPRCKVILDAFGEAVSRFTKCAVINSRPFKFCEDCVKEYTNVTDYFNIIEKDEDECKDILLRKDRIMLVEKMKDFAVGLWTAAKCDGCFPKVDGKPDYTSISNDTLHFEQLFNMTIDCFGSQSEHFGPPILETKPSLSYSTENTTVCTECLDVYNNLSLYFDQLGRREEICMDIVDAINFTQNLWSNQFECKQPVTNGVVIVTLSAFFCLLPVIFYVGSRILTVQRERKLVKRKSTSSSKSLRRS